MILDKGICSIFAVTKSAPAGGKPVDTLTLKYQSWYGELDFSSEPSYETDYREDVEVSARIRIHQNREVTTRDALYFSSASTPTGIRYEIVRAYHGTDDESGIPITDLSLRRVN
jgi:hypothetical protein